VALSGGIADAQAAAGPPGLRGVDREAAASAEPVDHEPALPGLRR